MSSPSKETEEPSSSGISMDNGPSGDGEASVAAAVEGPRPPAKRRLSGSGASGTVIEISDTDSDDSDICAVTTYQATADEVKRIRGGNYSQSQCVVFYSFDAGTLKYSKTQTTTTLQLLNIVFELFCHTSLPFFSKYK